MIIIIGPDHTGKTTLAEALSAKGQLKYLHYTKDSTYKDYLVPMCSLSWTDAVLDRHAACELPYSIAMGRKFRFSLKEWHNIILTTLIQNPLVILCTNKPSSESYSEDQYLPYERWDLCLRLYRQFLSANMIPYMSYDYMNPVPIDYIIKVHHTKKEEMDWWRPMWRGGWGCVGSPSPKVLLVAERLGPNNMNNIPFETGPTGLMLTELLNRTATPFGQFTVTNLVKAPRRDGRPPNDHDLALLDIELSALMPEKVILMGATAKKGAAVAKLHGIDCTEFTHFGYYSHKGDYSIDRYVDSWKKLFTDEKPQPL